MQVLADVRRTEREHGELAGTWLARKIHEAFWENEMAYETTKSPMGWYYRIEPGAYLSAYRCMIGTAWERMEVGDLSDFTPDELRFIADLMDAARAESEKHRP